jgi:hypothetical protein
MTIELRSNVQISNGQQCADGVNIADGGQSEFLATVLL